MDVASSSREGRQQSLDVEVLPQTSSDVVIPPSPPPQRRQSAPKQGKKRQRSEEEYPWIHIAFDEDGSKKCRMCALKWKASTSITVIKSHLLKKHCISDPGSHTQPRQTSTTQQLRQKLITDRESVRQISTSKRKRLDDIIVKSIVGMSLPHSIVENPYFIELLQKASSEPAYIPIGRHTVRRRLTELFESMFGTLAQFLKSVKGKFSISFDGWSNCNLRGYYSVVLHWFDDMVGFVAETHGIFLLNYFLMLSDKKDEECHRGFFLCPTW